MLKLTRRAGERIMIGDDIIIEIGPPAWNGEIEVIIRAPREIPIYREEIYRRIQAEKEGEK